MGMGLSLSRAMTIGGARGEGVLPNLLVNGDFSAGSTGWSTSTWVVSGGSATITNTVGTISQPFAFIIGRTYRVTFTVSGFSGTGGIRARFFAGTFVDGTIRSANGTYVEDMVAVTGNVTFVMASTTATFTGTIDDIKLQLLPA